jgi:two-component system cell cycle sensor histidine kinase/response regulator CckA
MDRTSSQLSARTIKTNGFAGLAAGREANRLRAGRLETFAALAGGAMHEMSNLLATVLMSVDVLRLDCQAPAGRGVLASLEEVARRGLGVAKQMQWLATGANCEKTLFQPRFLIADLQNLVSAVFPRSIMVTTAYPPDLWLLEGDPLLLYQFILGLLVAARDALPGGGTIAMSARNERLDGGPFGEEPVGRFVVFEVTARPPVAAGPRPPAVISRVGWEALGAPGGFLDPGSSRLPGCDRRLYLPAEEAEEAGASELRAGETPRGAGELVLVAEEEEVLGDMLAAVLEQNGYQVLTLREVTTGDERLSRLAVILTTPQAAGRVRALMPAPLHDGGLPRLVTMGIEPEQGRAGTILSKPFTTAQLLASLARVLGEDGPAAA